jgi:catechol 2,3-dioxygenase-like lactoylglutathione lyase family enzyme
MKMPENDIKISFDHYLLFAKNLDETVKWYGDVLNMRPGPLPDFDVPVHWLYLEDKPIIHVTERRKENQIESYIGKVDYHNDVGSGRIDHIAFSCTGLEKMLSKLDSLNIKYTERRVDTQSRYQVFFFDPNGVKIELDFEAGEAGNRMSPDI